MYNYCASNTSVSSPRSVSAPSCFQGIPIYHPAAVVHHLPLQSQYIGPLWLSPRATLLQLCCDHRRVPPLTCVMNISNRLMGGLLYSITT